MIVKKKTMRRKKKMPKWVAPTIRWSLISTSFLLFGVLVNYASKWSQLSGDFDLTATEIRGNDILGQDEIIALAKVPFAQSLANIDLKAIQRRVEKHSYVKGARVSREFPKKIYIDVVERQPIAYLNLPVFLVVDEEGVMMPLRHDDMEFNIPTLTGFNPAEELYPVGLKCLSHKTLEAVNYLSSMRQLFPILFEDISELTVNKTDEYVMVLAEMPTRIHFGQDNMLDQIILLKQFDFTLAGAKKLRDYRYVDLRYRNQIVVRERT